MIPLLVMSREVGGLTKLPKRCHMSMPAYDAGRWRFGGESIVEQGPRCPLRKRQPYVPQTPADSSKKSEGNGFDGPVPPTGGAPSGVTPFGGAPFGETRFLREEPR